MKFPRIHWETTSILAVIAAICIVTFFGFIIYSIIHNHQEQLAITNGYVVDKNYSAPYVSYRSQKLEGHSISTPVYHEATYMILVKSSDGQHEAWYEVTPLVYDEVKIGDYLSNVNRELK